MRIFRSEKPEWIHVTTSLESEDREIGGLKIWKNSWRRVENEDAVVIDPIYGETHHFGVYRMGAEGNEVEFAAGEFSNGVWGFYVRKPDAR